MTKGEGGEILRPLAPDHAQGMGVEIDQGFDPKDWTRYELRLRKSEVIYLVNGVEVGRRPRAADLMKGPLGIKVQFLKAEFRRLDIVQR